MSTNIYVAHHKEGYFLQTDEITPIHVGKGKGNKDLGIIGDDTGDNISKKNDNYCEMTALYWIWKNEQHADNTGLMHYRRYFDFADTYKDHHQTEVFLNGQVFDFEKYGQEAPNQINALMEEYDIILPEPHTMPFSVESNYRDVHHSEDLDTLREIIEEKYPKYIDAFDTCMKRESFFLFNMFVTKREIFEQYAEWVFDVLFELEDRIDIRYYNVYQARIFGFLTERLLGVFMEKYLQDHPDTKVKYLKVLNLAGAVTLPFPEVDLSDVKDGDINIVVSSDENYVPHLSALFASIEENASPDHRYNIFILSSNISADSLKNVKQLLTVGNKDINMHVIPVDNFFGTGFRSNHTLPSFATYNRFVIFYLLKDLKRLLYLDSDMVVLDDLVDLFRTDMGEYPLAAVPDYIMTRCLNIKVNLPDGYPDLKTYLKTELKMDHEDIANYFNAGLMLINFENMDPEMVGDELMDEAQQNKYYFQDQDILNKYFRKNFILLPSEYNVFNSLNQEFANIPWTSMKKVQDAKQHPKIIHFAAAHNKPWKNIGVPFDHYYWSYLRKTPYYERVMLSMRKQERSMVEALEETLTSKRMLNAVKRTAKNKLRNTVVHRAYHKVKSRG
ncbi:DUF4422 domain-containing protein [Virgibacillus siamensis]|uniref:DUF4422 domain-containing protein n=1 Tax=Virgibacillus siamensis TaxID=480071 RepID=UPI0009871AFB|nr:DUF4422 domain-containing protein [Virgibacillus siamensis]